MLTAGHVAAGLNDNSARFQVSGPGGTVLASNMVRTIPLYGGGVNDLSLMRSKSVSGVTPLTLAPESTNVNGATVQEVGFGRTNPAVASNFQTKRFGIFTVNAVSAANNTFTMPTAGAGTADDPTRHSARGDSGGPYILQGGANAGTVVGVHNIGTFTGGMQTSQSAASITNPYMYNYITSYTQRSIFWDKVTVGSTVDGLNSVANAANGNYGYGLDGVASGWTLAAAGSVTDPRLGTTSANSPFHYFNAIGKNNANNPELYNEGDSSQGESETAAGLTGGGVSIMKKQFTVTGGGVVTVSVQQRWNSLYLADDMGVGLPNGQIIWNGAAFSAANTLDQWFVRTQNVDLSAFAGPVTLTVYLVNDAAPEPAGILLMAVAGGIGGIAVWRKRRRNLALAH